MSVFVSMKMRELSLMLRVSVVMMIVEVVDDCRSCLVLSSRLCWR